MDYAHDLIDERIKELEERLTVEYSIALTELQEKAMEYFDKFTKKDALMRKKVTDGQLSQKEYIEWRKGQIMYNQHYRDLIEELSNDLTRVDELAIQMINQNVPYSFIDAANYSAYEIETTVNSGVIADSALRVQANFEIYNIDAVAELIKYNFVPQATIDTPRDLIWNRQKIQSAIIQGIMQGDSIPHLADRLQLVTNMDRKQAIRNARTLHTAAESKGRQDSYERATEMGIELQQEWLAVHDNRTRDAHRELDGVIKPLGEPFENSIGKIRYPADTEAHPSNFYNCRCALRGVIKGHEYKTDRYSGEAYEAWKKGKKYYTEWLEGKV